jgi:hypothetical protein
LNTVKIDLSHRGRGLSDNCNGDTIMSFQNLETATATVRNSGGLVERFADRVGMFLLLAMGLAMGGVTAFAGL